MESGENKRKHLEFLQSIINRMANNSFYIKGWAVTIISGIYVFLISNEQDNEAYAILFLPIITFWVLDGFFLAQERSYISKYVEVSLLNEDEIDFNLEPLSKDKYIEWFKAMFSAPLILFYLLTIIVMTVIVLFQ